MQLPIRRHACFESWTIQIRDARQIKLHKPPCTTCNSNGCLHTTQPRPCLGRNPYGPISTPRPPTLHQPFSATINSAGYTGSCSHTDCLQPTTAITSHALAAYCRPSHGSTALLQHAPFLHSSLATYTSTTCKTHINNHINIPAVTYQCIPQLACIRDGRGVQAMQTKQ